MVITSDATQVSAPSELIESDVLIIGGGVQGLWLLNELTSRGYAALLLERGELGGEQTCHSHVYIHRGLLYREEQEKLIISLRKANRLWDEWLVARPIRPGACSSYFGFQNPAEAEKRVSLWQKLGVEYTPCESFPYALGGTAVNTIFRSPESCFDGESLVEQLRGGVGEFISQINQVERITLSQGLRGTDGMVEEVQAVFPTGEHLVFHPRALVLAAGAGNQLLLDLTAGGRHNFAHMHGAQQIRKGHMLVVKGEKRLLPPLTGIFPDTGSLFIVSRECGDEVVWLVSDDRSPPVTYLEDWWMEYNEAWWVKRVLLSLMRLAPHCFGEEQTRRRMRWGIYEAPKAEGKVGGSLPHEERVEQFQVSNLWAVWPTKLTLAPKVSAEVTEAVASLIGPSRGLSNQELWEKARKSPGTARERWSIIPLVTWEEFCRWYRVNYV